MGSPWLKPWDHGIAMVHMAPSEFVDLPIL